MPDGFAEPELSYRTLFAAAADAIIVADYASALIVDANPVACAWFGYSLEELRTMKGNQLHPSEEFPKIDAFSNDLRAGRPAHDTHLRCLRKDGTTFWGEVAASVCDLPKGSVTVAIIHDISERIAHEENLERARGELARSEEQYRAVLNLAADAILVSNFDSALFVDANPAACRLFGYSVAELAMVTGRMLHPPDQSETIDKLSAEIVATGRGSHPSLLLQRKDGSTFWGELRCQTYSMGGSKLYVTMIRDVSERVERERELAESYRKLRETQAQLVAVGKLSALGQLGAGIAHELNQPLTIIQGFAERMRSASAAPGYEREIELIVGEARRMARIIDNVRTFARQTPVDHDCIDAVEPLEAALILVSRQLELRGIEIARDIEPGLPKICGDFFKLQQIYLNFITNARDALAAVASGRRLTISAQRIGDAIDIALENNGPTIPEDVRPKLFDPFFTTKEPNEGTGLGLSISYGIAREHGGDIRHETPAGGGARFVLRLPVAPRQSSR